MAQSGIVARIPAEHRAWLLQHCRREEQRRERTRFVQLSLPFYAGLAKAQPGRALRPVTAYEIEPDPLPDQEALPMVFDDEGPRTSK